MEFLAESFRTLLDLRHRLEAGVPTAEALAEVARNPKSHFESQLTRWWWGRQRGAPVEIERSFAHPLQRQLVAAIDRSLRGESILGFLADLEGEMRMASVESIELHLQRLPVLLLLPLIGLIFPSLMLLLVGPLLAELFRSLQ